MQRLLTSLPFTGAALAVALVLALPSPAPARAGCGCGTAYADCNGNGIEDAIDIASGASSDGNHDGVPDECQTRKSR